MGFPQHFAASSTAPTVTSPLESGGSSKRKYLDDPTNAEKEVTAMKAPRRGSVSDASPSQLATRIVIASDQQSAAKVGDGSTAESRQPSSSSSSSSDSSDKSKTMPPFRSKPPSHSSSFDRTELVGAFALASLSKGGGSSGSFSASFFAAAEQSAPPAAASADKRGNKVMKPVPVYADQRPGGFLPASPVAVGPADSPSSTSVRTPAEAVPPLDAHMAAKAYPHYHHPYPYHPYGYYYGMHPLPTSPAAASAGYPVYPAPLPAAFAPPPPPQAQAQTAAAENDNDPGSSSTNTATANNNLTWACDYCSASSFGTYEEACAHEATCKSKSNSTTTEKPAPQKGKGVLKVPGSPPRPNDAKHVRQVSWYPTLVDGGRDAESTSRVTSSAEEEARDDDSEDGATTSAVNSNGKSVIAYNPQPISEEEKLRLDREAEAAEEFSRNNLPLSRPVPLCVSETDPTWLSDLNCYIRKNCVQVFTASETDLHRTSKRGRISLHQVGLRCRFCTHDYEQDVIGRVREATAAISFPVSVTGIYESVKRWHRVHTQVCQGIPNETLEQLRVLTERSKQTHVPTSRNYWIESAKALGMRDSPAGGIYFHRQPNESVREYIAKQAADVLDGPAPASDHDQDVAGKQLVLCSERDEVTPYVFLLMSQLQATTFTEADRFVARSKGPIGYAGFECRHCAGHAGLGKYFPSSAKGMCTNSTSQNIHGHLVKCRRVPQSVKDELEDLKKGGRSKCNVKLSNGWRRKFFDKIWERLHDEAS